MAMLTQKRVAPFTSRLEYVDQQVRAAAVYCSDGRYGEHFDDFLHNGLGLPRYDRVALPGGPARLAEPDTDEGRSVLRELAFLVEVHELNRVVLIQHESCGFYRHLTGLEGEALVPRQAEDLGKAARAIAAAAGLTQIEGYHAKPTDDGMTFTHVELD